MKLTISKHADVNYLAKVIQIDNFRQHSDPEVTRLKCCTIDGFNIICGIDNEPGLYIYFPILSRINDQFLSYANQFKHSELNRDTTKKGMFEDSCRVKAIKLRGELSEGFIIPAGELQDFFIANFNKEVEFVPNTEFDSVEDGDKKVRIVKKYIVRVSSTKEMACSVRHKVPKGINKVRDDQFRFHYDTLLIKKVPNVISPNDIIHISSKIHGTSLISAYVLCHKELSWKEKIASWLTGYNFDQYDYLYSSRTVIKNKYYNKKASQGGYYDADVWEAANEYIKPFLQKGMTIYSEIVGYTQGGKFIQKGYDYGCEVPDGSSYIPEKHFKVRPYRITITNSIGQVHEFSAREVQQYCLSKGLIPVTELYYGYAKDLYPEILDDSHWNMNFLEALANDKNFYMELDSPDCYNKVPHEGIVIKRENMKPEAFKLKCFRFISKEMEAQSQGEVDMEDNA